MSFPLPRAIRPGLTLLLLVIGACGGEERAPGPGAPEARSPEAAPSRPGRIVLLSMDTVRADAVAGYGADAETPNLRAVAAEGVLFRDFYAASNYTLPSTMSIFTGLDPLEHGAVNESVRIGPEIVTLAEALVAAGYRAQAVTEGGYVAARFGFGDGFEEYRELFGAAAVSEGLWGILGRIREMGDDPYFLFLHTYAAHYPYGGFERYRSEHPERGLPSDEEIAELKRQYPSETRRWGPAPRELPLDLRRTCTLFNEMSNVRGEALACGDNWFHADFLESPHFEMDNAAMRRSYELRIGRIDRAIGEIRNLLVELGQWEDTLLVVTSDHGEAFWEHGWAKHDYLPWEEVLRAPLIVSWPRVLPKGRVISGLAWHLDLAPTILALAGVEAPPEMRGIDLSPVLRGRAEIPEDRTLHPIVLRQANRSPQPMRRVVRRGSLKYIEGHEHWGDAEGFLFDLAESPDEKMNLREDRSEQATVLAAEVEAYVENLQLGSPMYQGPGAERVSPFPGEVESPYDVPEEAREAMRALGYL